MWRICFDIWAWRSVFSETKNGSRLWENPENKSKKNKHKNSNKNNKSFLSLYWAIWKILSLLKHFEAKHLSRLLLCIFWPQSLLMTSKCKHWNPTIAQIAKSQVQQFIFFYQDTFLLLWLHFTPLRFIFSK